MSNEQANELVRILESLAPSTAQELILLRNLIGCAEQMRTTSLGSMDPGFRAETLSDRRLTDGPEFGLREMLASIPDHCRRFFHGLVEALDIYQGIHGQPLAIQTLSLRDPAVREIKQIRDMCLDEGLKSIY